MTYYVLCTPCLGDPARVLWFPGYVNWAYVNGRKPPLFAAYRTNAKRVAAQIVRDAVIGFGQGHVPGGPVAPKEYKPEKGDVLVTVVTPLPPDETENVYPPLVAVTLYPDHRAVQDMQRIPTPPKRGGGGVRRVALDITTAVNLILL